MITDIIAENITDFLMDLQYIYDFKWGGEINSVDANGIDRCINELAMYIELVIKYQKQNEKKPKLKELLELFDNVDWDKMSIKNNEMCVKIKFDTH